MMAQNGARHSWTTVYDETWLGTDMSPTPDGTPNANAKGDPGDTAYPGYPIDAYGTDYSPAGILQEENGIRMIPNPFPGNPVNQINQSAYYAVNSNFVVDPRSTTQGVSGKNLLDLPPVFSRRFPKAEGSRKPANVTRPGQSFGSRLKPITTIQVTPMV